jgi:hypothetical protein
MMPWLTVMNYNVLFPNGKVKGYYVLAVAEMYRKIGNGVLLPTEPLDRIPTPDYNGCVVNDMETI